MNKQKLRRKTLTVSDLLTQDDVQRVLGVIAKEQTEITDMVICYRDKDGDTHFQTTYIELERAIFLLERAKQQLMEDSE